MARRFPQLIVPSAGITGIAAEDKLLLVTAVDGTELVQLGHHVYGPVCLDPSNGQVVDLVTNRGEVVRGPLLVNSSLDQFIQTTRAATELFPYHDADPDADTEAAADALRAQLEPIDPAAWQVDGYWDAFYWDVAIGDYSPDQFEPPPPPL
ncbi:SUKH-4 family immunity protein [Micromonospora sp. NPDC047738]|uniref:SUKH-4 family immunity protein n=1 Tax=Micromonospora sp. NPDC047738 TaxID=3155741 RepID=UPI0033F135D7